MSRVLVDSGIKWIGSLPNTWGITSVNKIFYRRKEVNDVENPTVLSLARDGVKIRDISTNEGQLAESYDNYHKVYKDDLMINPMDLISGANCSLSEVEGVISPAYINLAKKENIFPKYYDYFFKYQYWVNAMFIHGKGVSFNNRWTMNWETMSSYKLPFPKIEEQKTIADYLDKKCSKINDVINDNNTEIKLLEEYKNSLIIQELSKIGENYVYGQLKHFIHYESGGILKDVLNSGNCKYIKMADIDNFGNIDEKKLNSVNASLEEIKKYKVNRGDLLVNVRNSYELVGKFAIIDSDISDCIFNHMIVRYTLKNIRPLYLKYYLLSTPFQKQLNLIKRGTTNVSAVYKDDFMRLKIKVPSMKIQNEIEEKIAYEWDKIDRVIDYRKQIIEKLEEYKRSLIYECVTGKREV